jgi:hypothetical protein
MRTCRRFPMKITSQCREQARQLYYGAVFEINEEIPLESLREAFLIDAPLLERLWYGIATVGFAPYSKPHRPKA